MEQPVLCNWFKADGAPGDVYFLQVGQDTPVLVRDDWCSRLACILRIKTFANKKTIDTTNVDSITSTANMIPSLAFIFPKVGYIKMIYFQDLPRISFTN